jgi:hypothetical protein
MTFPIVLAVFGALLFILGLLGQFEVQQFKLGTNSKSIRWFSGIMGVLALTVAGFSFRLEVAAKQPTQPEAQVKPEVAAASFSPVATNVNPNKLIEIIKEQQQKHVKESFGEFASQSFTEEDLRVFVDAKVPAGISETLKHDNQFIDVVLAIKNMPSGERQKLLDMASQTCKPTWGQLGKISREGQTDAGQRAEKMIASAIVTLVKDILKLPIEEIKKLYV